MTKFTLILCAFLSILFAEPLYVKVYFLNGNMKEEGWMFQNKKIKYWFYYYENGNKKEEGHYANNQKTDWWILYHKNVNISKKMTYKSNELHGFTFIYENEEVVKAQQFPNGNVIQEWTSYDNYKKDNPDFFRW